MTVAELHFFDREDPNGDTIFECSTDDSFLKGLKLNIQRDSLGGGQVSFARKVPAGGLFTRGIIVPETLVRVLVPAIDTTHYLQAFWINPRQQQVISKSEQGGEGFTFAGPGPKHYLERMLLWSASFDGNDGAVERDSGIWTWPETAKAGRILSRLLDEDAANPSGPFLPDLTTSFGDVNDSGGVPWADDISGTDDFTLKIQDDYLRILWQIEDASGITTRMNLGTVSNPLLQLDAYQTFGRNLEGDEFDTDVVLFIEGQKIVGGPGNIATELEVEGSSYLKASHALVKGNDGKYELAVNPSFSPGDLRKVVKTHYDSANNATLDRAGERFLRRQDNGERQIKLGIVPGFDAESGLYMPSPEEWGNGHYWVGDTITLTTGIDPNQTELDYDAEPQVVTGIELELGDAVRDDTPEQAARSWIQTVFLNYERKGSGGSSDLAGSRGTVQVPGPTFKLCRLPTEGTSETRRRYFSSDSSGVGSLSSDASVWGDAASRTIKSLKTAPDDTYGGGGSGQLVFSGVGVGVSNLDCDTGGFAMQITDADLLAAVQAGGMALVAQMRARSRFGVGINEASQDNIYQWVWRIRRTSGGGSWVGTMFGGHSLSSGGALKFPAQSTAINRAFSGTAAAVAGAALNDWIVVEIGCRHFAPTSGGSGATIFLASNSGIADLPEDESTSTNFNSWIELRIAGVGATDGDKPLDTVRQGEETAGEESDTRVSRCGHQHAHGLLAFDGSNYHDLSQIAGYIFDAGAAPTVNDDGDDGYVIGALWLDHSVSPAQVYILVDPTAGAAVWERMTPGLFIEEDGTPEGGPIQTINFTGAGVDVSVTGTEATVDIAGSSGGGFSHSYKGYNSIGATTEQTTAFKYYLKKITLAAGEAITSIDVYYRSRSNAATPSVGAQVLEDNAGTPRQVRAFCAPTTVNPDSVNDANQGLPRWVRMPVFYFNDTGANQDVWIGVQFSANTADVYKDTSGTDRHFTSVFAGAEDGGFRTITTTTDRYSIRASVLS